MPKHYRIMVTMVDEETNEEVASTTHEETYEDDADARQKFEQKEQAVKGAGRGQQR